MTKPAAPLPFVAAPFGDIDLAQRLAHAAAEQWGLAEPVLLRAGMNVLFSAHDVVLRVSRPTADPACAYRLATLLGEAGIRVPRFVEPEPFVAHDCVVFAVAREHSMGAIDWAEVGEMVARVHRLQPGDVRACYPLPRGASFGWWQFEPMLAAVDDLLDPAARNGLVNAIEQHAGWVDAGSAEVVCHGDVHPGNVIATAAGAVLLDWDLVCLAPVGWDHGPLLTWTERWGGEPGIYDAFASGYGSSLRADPTARALATLRLVAATLMRLRAGRTDPAAMAEAEQRLRWWRGDPDAPMWRSQ